VLSTKAGFRHLDPQRNYTAVDVAFATGYLQRTLTGYRRAEGEDGVQLVGDLATDTGRPSDGGRTWSFTLRRGVAFEDGQPITCADVKYGVSRAFATDVITDGPSYPRTMLAVPRDANGEPVYPGPYAPGRPGQQAFDRAVQCAPDDRTITFHLARPVPDFNHTVTLPAFSPVPPLRDDGSGYDEHPVSSGPYRITEYRQGARMTLERNEAWVPASDPLRHADVDRIVVTFGVDPQLAAQRVAAGAGEDSSAVTLEPLDPSLAAAVLVDPRVRSRAFDAASLTTTYLAINTRQIPNRAHRQAIAAAVDRAGLRDVAGGAFAGQLADGVLAPGVGGSRPTGLWSRQLGQPIPPAGDPAYARALVARSGRPLPPLTYAYPQSERADQLAVDLVRALDRAGITVVPDPVDPNDYPQQLLGPDSDYDLAYAQWGPDWVSASTVVPEVFTSDGAYNLSRYRNPAVDRAAERAARIGVRAQQNQAWAQVAARAMADIPVIPLWHDRVQYVVGPRVGEAFVWRPYASLPFGVLSLRPPGSPALNPGP